jgi:hypothetical protein
MSFLIWKVCCMIKSKVFNSFLFNFHHHQLVYFFPFKAILILIIRHAKEMREGSRQTRKAAGGFPFVKRASRPLSQRVAHTHTNASVCFLPVAGN